MKKISLDIAELRVESFATQRGKPAPSGTVRGREWSADGSDCGTYDQQTCTGGGRMCDCATWSCVATDCACN